MLLLSGTFSFHNIILLFQCRPGNKAESLGRLMFKGLNKHDVSDVLPILVIMVDEKVLLAVELEHKR